tara:strand:+ start:83 stop:547 length:465 start_codon:yes stop_codon:yes gene_type:complete
MKRIISILFFLCLINLVQAQDDSARKKHFNTTENVALSGYDPITYFVNKPVSGKKEYSQTHKGITYYFINEKSKSVFTSNPEKYEPAYGGWCAYALAKEKPVLMEADPETYKIINGKLYVFYNSFGINTIKKWNKEEEKSKSSADSNWYNIINK